MKHWRKKELYYLRTYYQDLSDKASDTDKIEIESTINSINYLLDEFSLYGKLGIPPLYKEIVASNYDFLKTYGWYAEDVRKLGNFFEDIPPYQVNDWQYIYTCEKGIFKFADNFYKFIGGHFYTIYKSLKKEFPEIVNFLRGTGAKGNAGLTYNIYKTDIVLFNIYVNNNAQDYVTMIHELGHGINIRMNGDVLGNVYKHCLGEVDGLFFELLANDFLAKYGLEEEGIKAHLAYFKNYGYIALMFSRKMTMMNELTKKQVEDKRIATAYLKRNFGKNRLEIKDTLNLDFGSYFKYIISYLVAIELYLKFYQDKDETLEILEKILSIKEDNAKGYLDYVKSLGIIPGLHLNSYFEKIWKEGSDYNEEGKVLRYQR